MPAGEDPSEGFSGPGGAADSSSRGGPTGPGGGGGGIQGFNTRFNNFMNANPTARVPGAPSPGSPGGPMVPPPAVGTAAAVPPQEPMMDGPAAPGALVKMRVREARNLSVARRRGRATRARLRDLRT